MSLNIQPLRHAWQGSPAYKERLAHALWRARQKRMQRGIAPLEVFDVDLGDGWVRLNHNSYEFNTSVNLYPALSLKPIEPRREYRLTGNVTAFDGTGGRIVVRLGQGSPDWFSINGVGAFDEVATSGTENDLCSLIVLNNTNVSRVVIEDLTLIPTPQKARTHFTMIPADRGAGNAGFNFGGIISPDTLGGEVIYQVASFGENFIRVDLGITRKDLLEQPPSIGFLNFGDGQPIQLAEQVPSYSYGANYPGLAAYLTSEIGNEIPFYFTDVEPLVVDSIVFNGHFDENSDEGWTYNAGYFRVANNRCEKFAVGAVAFQSTLTEPLETGVEYTLRFDLTDLSGGTPAIKVGGQEVVIAAANGSYKEVFIASNLHTSISIIGTNATYNWDNVVLYRNDGGGGGGGVLDLDHDGLPDTTLAGSASSPPHVTEDADSINIDFDGDGNADTVIPK